MARALNELGLVRATYISKRYLSFRYVCNFSINMKYIEMY